MAAYSFKEITYKAEKLPTRALEIELPLTENFIHTGKFIELLPNGDRAIEGMFEENVILSRQITKDNHQIEIWNIDTDMLIWFSKYDIKCIYQNCVGVINEGVLIVFDMKTFDEKNFGFMGDLIYALVMKKNFLKVISRSLEETLNVFDYNNPFKRPSLLRKNDVAYVVNTDLYLTYSWYQRKIFYGYFTFHFMPFLEPALKWSRFLIDADVDFLPRDIGQIDPEIWKMCNSFTIAYGGKTKDNKLIFVDAPHIFVVNQFKIEYMLNIPYEITALGHAVGDYCLCKMKKEESLILINVQDGTVFRSENTDPIFKKEAIKIILEASERHLLIRGLLRRQNCTRLFLDRNFF